MRETGCDAYIICTSPRSGSTLLCRLLRQVEHAGHPGSHFHDPSLRAWTSKYFSEDAEFGTQRDALQAIFEAAIQLGKGRSDVFGLRLQHRSLEFFLEQLSVLHPNHANDASRLQAAFGRTRFIYLARESKLDQAISYIRAQQSGLWHQAPDGREIERLSPPQDPTYDRGAITQQIRAFKQMDAAWIDWFESQGITPLRISYSALSDSPFDVLSALLAEFGLEACDLGKVSVPTAKLANAINLEWADRYRADLKVRSQLP